MNKLFVYGCSYTYGNGALPDEVYTKKYKKSEDDLIWPEIVAKEIGYKLYNYAEGGASNDIIFDNIIFDNYEILLQPLINQGCKYNS